ncbi:hypothetical protein BJ741DRAFT_586226 [Chytriomyces cf. hyalinus JEL632]|nr:hypothetical protein BJ741DRAFT_586226 [Chytriomyces cf. hyalinus JEL632]
MYSPAPARRDVATDKVIALVATLPDCLKTAINTYVNGALSEAVVRSLCASFADGSLIAAVTPSLGSCPAADLAASLPALESLKTDCDAVIAAIPVASSQEPTTADASASESSASAESTSTDEVSVESTESGAEAPTSAAASSKAAVTSVSSAKASATAKATAAATATVAATASTTSKSSAGQVAMSVFGAAAAALFML